VQGLQEVTVWITSQIGKPISSPQAMVVEVTLADGTTLAVVHPQMQRKSSWPHHIKVLQSIDAGVYAVC
jgi:S-adenosylmethionine synthetase